MRTVDELLASGHAVIDRGFFMGGYVMMPLFSGGHDSLCAVHLASQHPKFDGKIYHIDTGIGSAYTRRFVERVCERQGWELLVFKSPSTYQEFIEAKGFPGPGMHQFVYMRLKERCIRAMTPSRMPRLLINGARSAESVRRMGCVEPIQVGRLDKKTGRRVERKWIWTAPCHDWTKAEQQHYMDEMGLPVNRLKVALGLSGECFCGAFAAWKGRDLLDCPVAISAVFLFARVKGHYGTGRNAGVLKASAPAYHAQSPDLAKLVRTIEDALTGVVWRDDKQVCEYLPPFKREWTTGSECAEITVYELAK